MTEMRLVYITMQGEEIELCSHSPPWLGCQSTAWTGPLVVLWRRQRDGTETREVLPELFAEWALHAIPECEPDVARARIER